MKITIKSSEGVTIRSDGPSQEGLPFLPNAYVKRWVLYSLIKGATQRDERWTEIDSSSFTLAWYNDSPWMWFEIRVQERSVFRLTGENEVDGGICYFEVEILVGSRLSI